jgi:RNA polymerase sigma factor (sigma-70 family)
MAALAHSVHAPFRTGQKHGTVAPVAGLASRRRGADDDAALARRASRGDGEAFAELYERHEGRVFNLCYRILGSRDDAADATQEAFLGVLRRLPKLEGRDLAFGSYVLTSARNASYDLIERGKRAQPTEEIPETAGPVGGGFDPGDPEDDPERNMLLEARTEEIRVANLSLPERQREVLALRELEDLSYDEIADIMEMNRNSVAQLISRARINLRDALRGTALASIAAASADCERALPLIALEQDGQLDEDSNEAGWLGEHLMHCHTCRLGRDAMQEAGVSYRAWAPIAAGPLLFRETMARAAEHAGADWSETIARREARRGGAGRGAGGAAGSAVGASAGAARAAILRHRRRDLTLIGVLACLLVLVLLVGAATDDDPVATVVPASGEAAPEVAEAVGPGGEAAAERAREAAMKERRRRRREAAAAEAAVTPVVPIVPVVVPATEPEPEPEARPKRRLSKNRGPADRREGPGSQGKRRGSPAPEVPPEPAPPPTPTETAPAPPPPPPPTETTPPPAPPPQQPQQPPCSGPNCPRSPP